MADGKLTDEQVTDLVNIIRSDASLDAKVQLVNTIKSGIKQHNVPETSINQLFEGLRSASSSQHAALVNVGFTSLNHLLTRLSRQEPKLLTKQAAPTLPLVVDKLGDQKDKLRSTALQALNTFYSVAPADVERVIRNQALVGKNPRAKEGGMQWLLQTHKEQGLQFRSYVPLLMDLLEDADGMVRDAAKSTVIELFKNAPNAAKSDLKRQLKNFKVRPAIEQSIVKSLGAPSGRPQTPAADVPAPAPAPAPSRSGLAASTSSAVSERPITPALDRSETIEPQYVNTNRELDDIFRGMAWFFEGKETEQNWVQREQSMATLRKLNAGNVPSDFPDTFIAGLKSMLDGIIKAIISLRTSMCKEACGLVQDIAITFGPGMDPLVELLMQTFIKLAAGTKKISSQLANQTVDIMISRVSYNQRIMQHMLAACQDKNVQPRTYVSGWLKTILKKESAHKSHLEHSGGLDVIEKCIRKGLGDANPAVREQTRSTFWVYWGIWPQRADAIKEDLDSTAQKLLNKDPNNPNSPKKEEAARPGLGLSKSTMGSKSSLREHMLAQKKATLEAKKLPARPGSAMASVSPVRKVSDPAELKPSGAAKPTGSRVRPEAGTISVKSSGMSVAPMRPARRRPEMAARPATAGPYSMRDAPSVEDSPGARPRAPISRQPKDTQPRRTAQKPRVGHASHASESSINSAGGRAKSAASPKTSPAKLKTMQTAPAAAPVAPELTQPSGPVDSAEEPTPEASNVEDLAESSAQGVQERESVSVHEPEPEPTKEPEPTPAREPEPAAEPEPEASQREASPVAAVPQITLDSEPQSPALKVYEDPFVEESTTPKPAITAPVLEEKPVNEDAANLKAEQPALVDPSDSPEKVRQNSRLLDSGITKIKAKSLEVHGFRKFQSLIRDNKTVFNDEKFETVLLGLFQYLEDPLSGTAPEKAQDVKAQILTTIKLLLRKERDNFQPHVSKCLESLLQTRSAYDNRAHIVSGLELLSDDLVALGDPTEIIVVLTRRLGSSTDTTTEGCRALSMGLHVLKALLDKRDESDALAEPELAQLTQLAGRCLESTDSGVRMDAVQLCVALHARVGEEKFWEAMKGTKDDPKSLITYYIVKRQREQAA